MRSLLTSCKVFWYPGKRSELGNEKHDKDDVKLAPNEKFLDLDGSVDQLPTLERSWVSLRELLHIPFLDGDAGIMQGFYVCKE